MKDIFSVQDKVVIVTGAAKGNGKAIADGFVKAGSIVYYIDLLDAVKVNAKVDKTGRSKSYIVDLTNGNQISEFIRPIDHVDVLVNNAGITLPNQNIPRPSYVAPVVDQDEEHMFILHVTDGTTISETRPFRYDAVVTVATAILMRIRERKRHVRSVV